MTQRASETAGLVYVSLQKDLRIKFGLLVQETKKDSKLHEVSVGEMTTTDGKDYAAAGGLRSGGDKAQEASTTAGFVSLPPPLQLFRIPEQRLCGHFAMAGTENRPVWCCAGTGAKASRGRARQPGAGGRECRTSQPAQKLLNSGGEGSGPWLSSGRQRDGTIRELAA